MSQDARRAWCIQYTTDTQTVSSVERPGSERRCTCCSRGSRMMRDTAREDYYSMVSLRDALAESATSSAGSPARPDYWIGLLYLQYFHLTMEQRWPKVRQSPSHGVTLGVGIPPPVSATSAAGCGSSPPHDPPPGQPPFTRLLYRLDQVGVRAALAPVYHASNGRLCVV